MITFSVFSEYLGLEATLLEDVTPFIKSLSTHDIFSSGQIAEDVGLAVPDDGYEVHDRMVQVSSVCQPVEGDPLVQEADLRLRGHLARLHHDGHGVRLLVNLNIA